MLANDEFLWRFNLISPIPQALSEFISSVWPHLSTHAKMSVFVFLNIISPLIFSDQINRFLIQRTIPTTLVLGPYNIFVFTF
jgi:hypothetical protein